MIKTVIFDFDGTIADTLPEILNLYNKHAAEFSLKKIDQKEAEILRTKTPFQIIKYFGISVIKIPLIAVKIRKELNRSISNLKMTPGIKKVFEMLKTKELKLGILTSNSKENVVKFMHQNKLDLFHFIQSEKNLLGKSNSLEKLIEKYKLDKSTTLYVGDEIRDIDACKENGIKIISVTWGFNSREVLLKNNPDFIVDKPQDLLKII